MKCIVITPEKTVLNLEATYVALPLVDGEYGVLSGHSPLIARLGAGELRITGMDGNITRYYIEGGFAEILDDTIALLSMYALPAADLELSKTEAELEKELATIPSASSLLDIRQKKVNNYRARIRIAQKMAEQR